MILLACKFEEKHFKRSNPNERFPGTTVLFSYIPIALKNSSLEDEAKQAAGDDGRGIDKPTRTRAISSMGWGCETSKKGIFGRLRGIVCHAAERSQHGITP